MVGILFASLFGFPENAYANCINTIQAQAIANAYNGDETPTVHHMDTCSGDDVSYQIPIATTITFDGVQYSNIYATTNSVITFGQPDGTFWNYPNTPSISLYSMDWFPGRSGTSGLDIYYSEGGFQINLNMVPFGNYTAQPSTVNILVAITNTGGISVAYSYQGPEYSNMRTGVRLHDGSIVSLEAWGATQVSAEEPLPTLQAAPVDDIFITPTPTPEPTPEPTPISPEEQQQEVAESTQLATQISELNNLIALINGEDPVEEVTPDPEPTAIPDPEPTQDPLPEPDVVVDPEIVTPEDPRFPDDQEQTEPKDPNPTPSPDTTDGGNEETDPTPEPSEEPSPQPTDIDQDENSEPVVVDDEEVVSPPSDNTSTNNAISEEELNNLNKIIATNDAKLLAQLTDEQKEEVAEALGIQAEEISVIAELAQSSPAVAKALESFAEKLEANKDSLAPYTLADAITEENVEMFLENPIAALTNIDLRTVLNPSEWGKDMTDDQREKLQEVVVPVIIASNIIAASMTRRIG